MGIKLITEPRRVVTCDRCGKEIRGEAYQIHSGTPYVEYYGPEPNDYREAIRGVSKKYLFDSDCAILFLGGTVQPKIGGA